MKGVHYYPDSPIKNAILEGRVIDVDTNQGISNVEVWLKYAWIHEWGSQAIFPERCRAITRVDQQGNFRIQTEPAAYLILVSGADGYHKVDQRRRAVRLKAGTVTNRIVKMSKSPLNPPTPFNWYPEGRGYPAGTARITGLTGPDAQVILFNILNEIPFQALADQQGRFEINEIPAGDYRIATGEIDLWFRDDPRPLLARAQPITLAEGEHRELTLDPAQ